LACSHTPSFSSLPRLRGGLLCFPRLSRQPPRICISLSFVLPRLWLRTSFFAAPAHRAVQGPLTNPSSPNRARCFSASRVPRPRFTFSSLTQFLSRYSLPSFCNRTNPAQGNVPDTPQFQIKEDGFMWKLGVRNQNHFPAPLPLNPALPLHIHSIPYTHSARRYAPLPSILSHSRVHSSRAFLSYLELSSLGLTAVLAVPPSSNDFLLAQRVRLRHVDETPPSK
jgi:hypothetical protein